MLTVLVKDSDDLPPKFTEGVYRTRIQEFFPLTVSVHPHIPHNHISNILFNAKISRAKQSKYRCNSHRRYWRMTRTRLTLR